MIADSANRLKHIMFYVQIITGRCGNGELALCLNRATFIIFVLYK